MSESRTLVVAAVAGGALYLAGPIALGTPPHATDSGAHVLGWFRDHTGLTALAVVGIALTVSVNLADELGVATALAVGLGVIVRLTSTTVAGLLMTTAEVSARLPLLPITR